MITERTLKRWRVDALNARNFAEKCRTENSSMSITVVQELEVNERVIRLTGELLDQHLLNARRKS